jgi:hypothetical protein
MARRQSYFIAGAGVSMPQPSNLPSFRKLVLDVYEALRDPLFEALSQAVAAQTIEERNQILTTKGLSAKRRVEANLFFREEYDRLFAALEARLDQNAKGLIVSRKVRDAVERILRVHGGDGPGHRDLIRISTAAKLTSDPQSGGLTCRIATTNFDLLLEEAAAAELPNQLPSFDARMAPRPGSYDFEGIIHLHGMLAADPGRFGNLVLSSRDFARTYLRSGVVANYVYDLVRRYRVVLVGYSADDPTMRYLMDAIGEDAALFDGMHKPYSIAARDPQDMVDPLGDVFTETWRAKNIEPIPYDFRVLDRHGALWETLRQWAEWARHDLEWVKEQCAAAMALPLADADGFARNFVQELFSILDQVEQASVIRFLNEKAVDFDWIDIIQRVPEKPLSAPHLETVP